MRRRDGWAAITLLALALGGCSSEADTIADKLVPRAAATPAYGDTYIDSLLGNVSSLIPNITADAGAHDVGALLYNGLVSYDRDLNAVGELAESWAFSGDCLDLTFRLRKGVRWHDGAAFDARDVVFTYEAVTNPKTPSPYKSDFADVESVQAVDPYTVRVHYRKPYAKALVSWATAVLPRHLLEGYVRDGKVREAPQNFNAPVGTGPYRFKELKSGDKIVVVANQDYFGRRPNISRVVYRIIPSQATMFLELKAKAIDAVSLTALQYKRQTDYPAFRRAYNKYRYPSNSYTYFGFNLRDPRFADRRVRQAFAYAINRQELIDGVILGLGREATGPFKPGSWVYTDKVRRYPHDPAKARALLAEAGWRHKNDEGLLVKDGVPFKFQILTNQGNDERKKIAEIIQATLREYGIGVEIRVLEWAAFLKEHIKKRNFEAIVMGWGIGIDPDQFGVWHSSQQGPDELNHIGYASPEADALLEAARSTCVPAERVRFYHRFQELMAEDQPLVFLYFRDALPAVSSRVYGIDPGPAGIKYNFHDWFVPKTLHRYTAG